MGSISVPTAILGAGALSAGGGLVSGMLGANAAQNAAQIQASAAMQAAQLQYREFGDIRRELAPFMSFGKQAMGPLDALLGLGRPGGWRESPLLQPLPGLDPLQRWHPTMSFLEKTPGYQFALRQGLQATQNSFAAQGLGQSGAALKGAAQYAQGLASTTYQQQFQNYLAQQGLTLSQNQQQLQQNQQTLQQRGQEFGMFQNILAGGQNAAAQLGGFQQNLASNVGNLITSAAAAQAGGIVGSTNAITNALGGVTGAGANTALLLALNNAGIFGGQGQIPGATGGNLGLGS